VRSTQDTVLLFLALGISTYACRIAGYWLMGLVKATPRVEAALRVAPLAVMIGIVAPAALRGGLAEAVGLVVTAAFMWWRRHDLFAALAGVVVVAVWRLLAR
jgi:uncharacterized membrane protein